MPTQSNWSRDFPFLTSLIKHPIFTTIKLTIIALEKYEVAVRVFIKYSTYFLVIYLVSLSLNPSINTTPGIPGSPKLDAIPLYRQYYQLTITLWALSLLPVFLLAVMYWQRMGLSKAIRIIVNWIGLFLLITFSGTLASLAATFITSLSQVFAQTV